MGVRLIYKQHSFSEQVAFPTTLFAGLNFRRAEHYPAGTHRVRMYDSRVLRNLKPLSDRSTLGDYTGCMLFLRLLSG